MVHCVIAPGMPRSLIETLHLLSKGTRMESIQAVETWKRRKRYSCGRCCLPCRLTIWPRLLNLVKNLIPRISLSHDRGLLSSLPKILNASIWQITSFKKQNFEYQRICQDLDVLHYCPTTTSCGFVCVLICVLVNSGPSWTFLKESRQALGGWLIGYPRLKDVCVCVKKYTHTYI